jgi:intein/homing endonuclease
MEFKEAVLISQKDLEIIKINKNYVIVKARRGPSKETKIPLKITPELSFITATIIGDGHLRKSKKQITIELTNMKLLKRIQKDCIKLFDRTFNINPVKGRINKKQSWQMPIDSKAIYNLLNQTLEIPIGKKSHIVLVPKFIEEANNEIQRSFLQGIMLTEGGERRRGYGLSTASKKLWEGLQVLLKNQEIPFKTDKWVYQKYKKEYYGLVFKKDQYPILMRRCRSGQTGCV